MSSPGRRVAGYFMFGVREVFGWLLVGLGLYAFWVAYFRFLSDRMVIEGGICVFAGFTLFRGGIHLLKVAIAAQIVAEPADPEEARANPGRPR